MVTKLRPLCEVKLLKNDGDKLVVRSPEKAGVGGSTPSLATTIFNHLPSASTFILFQVVPLPDDSDRSEQVSMPGAFILCSALRPANLGPRRSRIGRGPSSQSAGVSRIVSGSSAQCRRR